ncbi:unnamed protein product [Paramecium sonneborni]|uniref:Tetratricopeptide repeat protein n=1 Tax=Paramecium sonneborni TaxID=65129 RepID=A0A8S1Q5P6_9CILI|nr:unnamed protein product [Paramecium sonneborni]
MFFFLNIYLEKFKRDKELLECFKEVSSQIKSLNLFFEGLNVKINLNKESFVKITIYDDNQLDQAQKPHNQNDFMINLYCEAKDLYKKKKKIEAYEKFSEVLRINPSFVEARIYRGNLSLDVNNLSYAQFDFEEVLKQDKQNLKALKGITIALKMQCNYELGLKYALKILKHEPNSSQGNFNAADCLKFLGQYNDNILNYINQAIDQEKRRSDQKLQVYYRNKGEILFGLGREVEAREFVQKALLINQNYELALKTQKRFDEFTQNRVPT